MIDFEHAIVQRDFDAIIARLPPESVKQFQGKTVLITGANGFIGSYFLGFLLRLNQKHLSKPCKVYAVDIHLHAPKKREGLEWIEHNVTASWQGLPECEYIVFAAGIASPIAYRQEPLKTLDVTVTGLRHALDHAHKVKKFQSLLFFSSSEIYGDPDEKNIPTSETYRGNVATMGPRACYDESKRLGETLCYLYHKTVQVPVKIVRPFNVFGPGLSPQDGRVLPDFLRQLLKGENLAILSDGKPTRTFCYIEDAMVGFVLALLSPHQGDVFNIGSDQEEMSIRNLAECFIKASGKHVQVVLQHSADKEYLVDNPVRRRPDLTKSQRMLGYHSVVLLEEGLRRYYQYYREQAPNDF